MNSYRQFHFLIQVKLTHFFKITNTLLKLQILKNENEFRKHRKENIQEVNHRERF